MVAETALELLLVTADCLKVNSLLCWTVSCSMCSSAVPAVAWWFSSLHVCSSWSKHLQRHFNQTLKLGRCYSLDWISYGFSGFCRCEQAYVKTIYSSVSDRFLSIRFKWDYLSLVILYPILDTKKCLSFFMWQSNTVMDQVPFLPTIFSED